MADTLTQADSIRFYNTGAAADDDAQALAESSLGNYRSGTELVCIAIEVAGGPGNITVDFASGANGEGEGSLEATSSSTLSYTAPGGSPGPAESIANGETKIFADGDDPSKYVRVTRTSAGSLAGTATLTLTHAQNNAAAFANISPYAAQSGLIQYGAIAIKNGAAGSCVNVFAYVRPIVADLQTSSASNLSETTGSAITTDAAQLGASGYGSIRTGTAAAFAAWPATGVAKITESDGTTLREYVRYFKSGITLSGSPTNVTLRFAAQGNGAGTGTFEVNGAGTAVRWTPPSGTPGPWVTLANGYDRWVPGPGSDGLNKGIWVTCTGAPTASQSTSVTLTSTYTDTNLYVPALNRAQGGSSAAAGAGTDKIYRVPGGTVGGAGDMDADGWPDSGFARIQTSGGTLREIVYYSSRTATALTIPEAGRALLDTAPGTGGATDTFQCVPGHKIGIEAPSTPSTGNFSTIADRIKAPSGSVTWTTATIAANGASIGTMIPDDIYGIWIRQDIPAGMVAQSNMVNGPGLAFEAA